MKIFVSGGTGVIGRRVVPLLVNDGHTVTVARRHEVDLFDAASVRRAVQGHEVVINLATSIPGGPNAFFRWGWWRNDRIRRKGVRNLAAAAAEHRVRRFIQESFAPMYADAGAQWLTEESPIEPARHVRSAVEAERTVMALSEHGVTPVVLRFALFYGDDSVHTRDTIAFARKGRAAMFGDPEGYISSIHTDDAAAAVVAALRAPAGIYNVADDVPVTKREYFASLAAALGVPPPRFFPVWAWRLAGSVGENLRRSFRISNAKFKEATGWAPAAPSVTTAWPGVLRSRWRL